MPRRFIDCYQCTRAINRFPVPYFPLHGVLPQDNSGFKELRTSASNASSHFHPHTKVLIGSILGTGVGTGIVLHSVVPETVTILAGRAVKKKTLVVASTVDVEFEDDVDYMALDCAPSSLASVPEAPVTNAAESTSTDDGAAEGKASEAAASKAAALEAAATAKVLHGRCKIRAAVLDVLKRYKIANEDEHLVKV